MQIDKESHRELLLQYIETTPISGTVKDLEIAMEDIKELKAAIETAEVVE